MPATLAFADTYPRQDSPPRVFVDKDGGVEGTGPRLLRQLAGAVIRIHDNEPEDLKKSHWGPLRHLYDTLPPKHANAWGVLCC